MENQFVPTLHKSADLKPFERIEVFGYDSENAQPCGTYYYDDQLWMVYTPLDNGKGWHWDFADAPPQYWSYKN